MAVLRHLGGTVTVGPTLSSLWAFGGGGGRRAEIEASRLPEAVSDEGIVSAGEGEHASEGAGESDICSIVGVPYLCCVVRVSVVASMATPAPNVFAMAVGGAPAVVGNDLVSSGMWSASGAVLPSMRQGVGGLHG